MNNDVKVGYVGEPVAVTADTKREIDIKEIREKLHRRISKEFPRLTKSKHGDQRIAGIVQGILDDTKVQLAAEAVAERDVFRVCADRQERHRCDKCHSPLLPHDDICRLCEVRRLVQERSHLHFLLKSALHYFDRVAQKVDGGTKDGALQLDKATTQELSTFWWRAYSLLGVMLDQPVPNAPSPSTMNPWFGAVGSGMVMHAVMDAICKSWQPVPPATEPKK